MRLVGNPDHEKIFERRLVHEESGKVRPLPLPRETFVGSYLDIARHWPPVLGEIASALLDPNAGFAVHGNGAESIARYLTLATGARQVSPRSAKVVLAGRPLGSLNVRNLCPSRHSSARQEVYLLVACKCLLVFGATGDGVGTALDTATIRTSVKGLSSFSILGRGVSSQKTMIVDDEVALLLDNLTERLREVPIGLDLFLADGKGQVVDLPRTTSWTRT